MMHAKVWSSCRQEKHGQIVLPQLTDKLEGRVSEELCASAAQMANNLNARAIFVYTRRGYMANFLSRCRPDCPIFAFTGGPSLPGHTSLCIAVSASFCNRQLPQLIASRLSLAVMEDG